MAGKKRNQGEESYEGKSGEEEQKKKEESNVLFRAALFHPGTPLVAHSTAEAAGQSPLLIFPVTPHHWGQRALCLPINEPASATVPLSSPPSSHNPVGDRTEAGREVNSAGSGPPTGRFRRS